MEQGLRFFSTQNNQGLWAWHWMGSKVGLKAGREQSAGSCLVSGISFPEHERAGGARGLNHGSREVWVALG